MKILTAPQIRATDQYTIEHEPIASIDLMERASKAFTDWFIQHFPSHKSVYIVCGTGNNGGDGLAVARLLLEQEYPVAVAIIGNPNKGTPDFKANYERLDSLGISCTWLSAERPLLPITQDIIVDAIFGSGLARPVTGYYGEVIDHLNSHDACRVSIDIASGLFSDQVSQEGAILHPHHTVAFQVPKLAFFMPQNEPYLGDWHIADIGLDRQFIAKSHTPYQTIELPVLKGMMKRRHRHFHKGNAGRAMVVCGSTGKMGAAVLTARGCLRAGVGLLTLHIPKEGNVIVQTAVPEAMVELDKTADLVSEVDDLSPYDAVAFGPGLGTDKETISALTDSLSQLDQPCIVDADGLNILSALADGFALLPDHSIVTPHPKEFERMAGSWKDDFERLQLQLNFSKKYGLVVVLKGAYTAVSFPDGRVFFNTTGNPGMGSGGSGDVLTGILVGLLARGYTSEETALLGVYLHGLAGDFASASLGEESLIASDIIKFLPKALLVLYDDC